MYQYLGKEGTVVFLNAESINRYIGKYMKILNFKIQNKTIKYNLFLLIILHIVAYHYVFLSSINDGFTSFLLGIPYAWFLIWSILYLKNKNIFKYLNVMVLIVALILIVMDRGRIKFFYPIVGETFTIVNNENYTLSNNNYIDLSYDKRDENILKFKKGDTFTINKQMVQGHIQLTTSYVYEINSDNFPFKKDSVYYINGFPLTMLLRSQGIVINKHNRFENYFTYFSFYLFIYPVVLWFFIYLLKYRIEEKDS